MVITCVRINPDPNPDPKPNPNPNPNHISPGLLPGCEHQPIIGLEQITNSVLSVTALINNLIPALTLTRALPLLTLTMLTGGQGNGLTLT